MNAVAWLAAAAAAWAAPAPAPQTPEASPPALARIERALSGMRDLTASFRQTRLLAGLDEKIETTGTVRYKRPRRLRVELAGPMPTHVVADGKHLWVYFPELGQAERHPITGSLPASAIFQGFEMTASRLLRDYSLVSATEEGGRDVLVLSPRDEGQRRYLTRLELAADRATGRPVSITLTDAAGNTTATVFDSFQVNAGIPDAAFRFSPPPSVQIIEAEK